MTATQLRPTRRTWLLGAAGIAVAIAVGGGTGVLRPPSGSTPPASASPTDVPVASSSPDRPIGGPLGGGGIPQIDPRPWAAVDWRQVPQPFGARPDPALTRVDGIVAGGPGVMGWGRLHQPGRNQFNDMGAAYLSADGATWAVIPIDAGIGRRDTSEFHLLADGPAGIVVIGGVCCTDEERPALWRSSDGMAWERLVWPDAFGPRADLTSLTATEAGYVAGGSANGSAAFWTSPDGATWTPIDDPEARLGPGGIADIEPTADGLVAVGWQAVGGTSDGAVWLSRTGETWTPLAVEVLTGPLETTLHRIVPWARGWFVVGQEGTHEERIACEGAGRVASVAEPTVVEPPPLDFSCGWGVETHWLTGDGIDWQRDVPIGARPGAVIPDGALIEFRLLAAGGPGLVAFGEGSNVGAAAIFVSGDGVRWLPTGGVDVFPPGIVPSGFVVGGRTIAAVADGPSAWIGTVR